jgi:hypothetical protein
MAALVSVDKAAGLHTFSIYYSASSQSVRYKIHGQKNAKRVSVIAKTFYQKKGHSLRWAAEPQEAIACAGLQSPRRP